MTDKKPISDRDLDEMFADAAQTSPQPSADLVSRVIAEADVLADTFQSGRQRPDPTRRSGFFGRLSDALGGWPAVAALSTAAVAGLGFGYFSPESLATFSEGLNMTETVLDAGDFSLSFIDLAEES